MLVSARVGIALRCPHCGKTGTHEVPLFAFSGTGSVHLTCTCGHRQGAVIRHKGRMMLQLSCNLCAGLHRLEYSTARFWSGQFHPLLCQDTGLHMGALGSPEAVRSFKSPVPEDDVDSTAYEDFFVNPEVMYEVLAAVHDLEAAGRLRCRCGNTDIEYELQPDKLQLVCPECGSYRSLEATDDADANRARRARQMEIGGRKPQGRR